MEDIDHQNSHVEQCYADFLRSSIQTWINKHTGDSVLKHVTLIKRNKSLTNGDMTLICRFVDSCQSSALEEQKDTLVKSLKAIAELELNVQRKSDSCEVVIKLPRPKCFQVVLGQALKQSDHYGKCKGQQGEQSIAVNCVTAGLSDLNEVRNHILAEHVGKLLEANGYATKTKLPAGAVSTTDKLNIHLTDLVVNSEDNTDDLWQLLKDSQYRSTEGSGDSSDVVLDLGKFIEKEDICTGKTGYDKNLHCIKFTPDDGRFVCLRDMATVCTACDYCVHIVSAGQEYVQQQVDLTWQALHPMQKPTQSHLVVGDVSVRKSGAKAELPTLENFLSLRNDQMLEAAKLKYGDQVEGSGWMDTIMALTVAGIKFEFLSTSCRSQLKLDLCSDGPVDNRGGMFVMYNYARLATLQLKYQQAVNQGVYPELPNLESLDFTVLKDEEEWSLLYNYVMEYPVMIRDTVKELSQGKLRGPVQTHKVCHFLSEMSRDLSSYYRRVRILTEPRPHLYPTMHCRLYLLKALQIVMENALALLGVTPLSQL